ncbi:MAG: tetratricopeptide repeat protein [Deltaproteobacteria bacterium]|nr:tetratricopeptide repeat protein [Deltaproteobacteria bacterium]
MTPLFVCLFLVGQAPVVDKAALEIVPVAYLENEGAESSSFQKEKIQEGQSPQQNTHEHGKQIANDAAGEDAPSREPNAVSEEPKREPSFEELSKAKELFKAGGVAYAQGRYDVAIDAFEAAHAISPRASLQFSLAQALRLSYFTTGTLNLLERSIHYYRAYLDDKQAPRRSHASQHLATLLPILERLRIENVSEAKRDSIARLIVTSQIGGALAQVNGSDFLPVPASFEVAPGIVMLKLGAPRHHSVEQRVKVAKESTVAVNIDLTPIPGSLRLPKHILSSIYLDGVAVTGPKISLSPGKHRIRIMGHGREPYNEDFEIQSEEEKVLKAELPITFQTWGGILAAGTGTGILALAGFPLAFAAQNEIEAASIGAFLVKRPLSVDEAARYIELEGQRDTLVRVAGVVALTGVSLLAVGGALVALDFPASSGSQE